MSAPYAEEVPEETPGVGTKEIARFRFSISSRSGL
jgi:hypothetical protein